MIFERRQLAEDLETARKSKPFDLDVFDEGDDPSRCRSLSEACPEDPSPAAPSAPRIGPASSCPPSP
jgi:hypothetical protein